MFSVLQESILGPILLKVIDQILYKFRSSHQIELVHVQLDVHSLSPTLLDKHNIGDILNEKYAVHVHLDVHSLVLLCWINTASGIY